MQKFPKKLFFSSISSLNSFCMIMIVFNIIRPISILEYISKPPCHFELKCAHDKFWVQIFCWHSPNRDSCPSELQSFIFFIESKRIPLQNYLLASVVSFCHRLFCPQYLQILEVIQFLPSGAPVGAQLS